MKVRERSSSVSEEFVRRTGKTEETKVAGGIATEAKETDEIEMPFRQARSSERL
jgi:hypothetical protein